MSFLTSKKIQRLKRGHLRRLWKTSCNLLADDFSSYFNKLGMECAPSGYWENSSACSLLERETSLPFSLEGSHLQAGEGGGGARLFPGSWVWKTR